MTDKRTNSQNTPPESGLRTAVVTPSHAHFNFFDAAGAMGELILHMTGDGNFHSHQKGHNGDVDHIVDGAVGEALSGHARDNTHHDDHRNKGGESKQTSSSFNQTGGDHMNATDGSHQHAGSSSQKNYTKSDGHHHMLGDQAFTVEEGGVHYNVAKDFSITATGDGIHINPSNELSMIVGGNEGHVVSGKVSYSAGDDITITSGTSITLVVGSSSITMTPSGITIKGTRVDINP